MSKLGYGGWYRDESNNWVLIKPVSRRNVMQHHRFEDNEHVALDVAILEGGVDYEGTEWGKPDDWETIYFIIGRKGYKTTVGTFKSLGFTGNYGKGKQHFFPLDEFEDVPVSLINRILGR